MKIVGILLGLVLLSIPFSVDAVEPSETERELSQAQSEEDVGIQNGTQFQIRIENFATATGTFSLELDNILKDYKHKEIIKRHILNYIFEEQRDAIAVQPEPEPEPIEEPFPEPEPDIPVDIDSAIQMGIIKTNCMWHLTQYGNFLTLNKEEQFRIILPFADCVENQLEGKIKAEQVIQIIKTESKQSQETTWFLFYMGILIGGAIAIGVAILFKQKKVESFRIQ